jgi:ADP-heptose:LPS heptosyltransferase
MSKPKANLVIRPEKLGDLIVSTPVFRAFKESFPDQPLHVMTDEIYAEALRYDPHVDVVIPIRWKGRYRGERDSWRDIYHKLSVHRYERAALLYYNVEAFNWLMVALGIRQVAQLGGTYSACLLGHHQVRRKMFAHQRKHYAEWYLDVAECLGARTSERWPRLYLLDEEKIRFKERFPFLHETKRRILVHPFGHGSSPNFSFEAYIGLALALRSELGAEVFFTGGVGESDRVRSQVPPEVRTEWMGTLSVREWMVASTFSDAVVAGSTGVIHASAALEVPTVGIYCPYVGSHPDIWGPLGKTVSTLIVPEKACAKNGACDSECNGNNSCDLSRLINAGSVVGAVRTILKI